MERRELDLYTSKRVRHAFPCKSTSPHGTDKRESGNWSACSMFDVHVLGSKKSRALSNRVRIESSVARCICGVVLFIIIIISHIKLDKKIYIEEIVPSGTTFSFKLQLFSARQ